MKLAYNPLGLGAYTPAPAYEDDIIFDLVTKVTYVKGVPFYGKKYEYFKKHTSPDNTGGSEGLVPAPSYTTTNTRLLREDGEWVHIPGASPPDNMLDANSTNAVENQAITKEIQKINAQIILKAEHVYKNIVVNGVLIQALGTNDTLEFIQGDGIALTPNPDDKTIIISTKVLGLLGINTYYASGQLVVKVDDLYYNHWNETYNWYRSVTDEDTDVYINKWLEIVDFLNNVLSGTNILDEFVTRKTPQEIIGAKTFTLPITSSVTDTSPFIINSPVRVLNLNVDMLDNYHMRKWFDNASEIDNTAILWQANGTVTDIPSMAYASVINVIGDAGRRWQIWNSRGNHQLYWRPELSDMSGYAPEHILLDSLNYKGFIELMYWANIPILSASDPNTRPTFGNTNINGILNINSGPTREALTIDSTNLLGAIVRLCQDGTPKMWYGYSPSLGGVYYFNENDTGIFLKDNNNVGIGITNPSYKLHVIGIVRSDALWLDKTNTTDELFINFSRNNVYKNLIDSAKQGLIFFSNRGYTSNTTKWASDLYIDRDSGYIGIGTTTPNSKLHVHGTTWIDAGSYIPNRATLILNSNGAPADIVFKDKSYVNGNYGHWTLSSRSGEDSARFSIFRGAENANIKSELELFTLRPDGDVDIKGTINLWNTTCAQNHDEGIRIHPSSSGWNALVFCGTDNTGDTGTSAKTWGLYTYNGNLYINKNSTNASAANSATLCNVNNNWGIGTTNPTLPLSVIGQERIIASANASSITLDTCALIIGPNTSGHTGYSTGIGFNSLSYGSYINHIHAWIGLGPYTTTTAAECYPLIFATNGSTTINTAPVERMRITPDGNVGIGDSNPVYKLEVNGSICGMVIHANRDGSTTAGGVSLYSNSDPMTYGIAFRGTGTYGTHGYVTAANDWATYLTMNDSTTRGWIFRRGSTNVASIAGSGNMAIGQNLEFSNGAHISTNRSTDYHYGYTFNLTDNEHSIGMYSGPIGEAGGVVISPDGCLIYNSSDCGYNLQVRDKDLGTDLTSFATLTFGIEQSGYYAWSRGGFKKSGSDDSYVLLGGGGHKLESNLSVSYATSAGNADTVDGYHATDLLREFWTSNPGYNGNTYNSSPILTFSYSNNAPYTGVFVDLCSNGYGVMLNTSYYSDTQLAYRRHGTSGDGGMGSWRYLIDNVTIGSQSVNYATSAGNADTVDGYHYNNLPYLPISGGWMNSGASINFKSPSGTTPLAKIGYATGSGNGVMHSNSAANASGAFYIESTGYNSANDWGGIAIDNEGVTVYGAGDPASNFTGVFRVLNEDNPADGPLFIVTKASGATVKYNMYAAHFYESSDKQLKTNIQEIFNSDKMPIIKEFNWKEDGSHSYGLIAQELEEQGYSELVSTKDDGYKTVNYSAALSLIVGKLQVKIKELEKEIEILKNKN